MKIQEILKSNNLAQKKALFIFSLENSNEKILLKFNLWIRYFFPKYFTSKDAPFHKEIDLNNLRAYRGEIHRFVDIAFRGGAKRQPLDAKIMTPNGWVTMGDIEVGDYVIGSDGKKTKVEFVSEIVDRPVYKITTEDGRSTECDGEHLWTVRKMTNVKNKHVTIDTNEMISSGLYYERNDKRYPSKTYFEYKYALETVKPIEYSEKELPLDPYLIGILLGDGSLSKDYGSARLHFHKNDESHYREIIGTKYKLGSTRYDKRNADTGCFGIHNIGKKIVELGLNVNCYNKFIPDKYLFGSIKQREDLLKGLMDTYGTTGGRSSFCTVSPVLANDVVSLVRSLGGKATISKHNYSGRSSYRVGVLFTDFIPFSLERKILKSKLAKKTWSRIIDISLVGNKLGKCISISNSDGLYVTDNYLLTHNTARTKLFIAFCIANDKNNFRKYLKVLAEDRTNSKQIVTDIYNMFISPRVLEMYPEIFKKTTAKREETMASFTTSTGVKLLADTVGTDQRGALQENARPDFIWFEDFENRKTIKSAVITKSIGDNMEEARTSLSVDGACIYTCNYISEAGNVHKLVQKKDDKNIVMIVPIINKQGVIAWDRYSLADIEQMKKDDEDFEGERLCEPSAGKDVYFPREVLENMRPKTEIKNLAGFKIFHKYDPSHRYGSGHDIAKGVGLDSCTSVFIDFDTVPARVVATYADNEIKPELFGDEIFNQQNQYPGSIAGVENNFGTEAILRLKQLEAKLYETKKNDKAIVDKVTTEYGWNTNSLTKPKMLASVLSAIKDGLLELTDQRLIQEFKSYTRHDLLEYVKDPRLTTRHFDLLMACAIAWQMKDFTTYYKKESTQDRIIQQNEADYDPNPYI